MTTAGVADRPDLRGPVRYLWWLARCQPGRVVLVGPLLKRLPGMQATYRQAQGALSERLVDIVEGLRVLNAFGGKAAYAEHYRTDSLRLRGLPAPAAQQAGLANSRHHQVEVAENVAISREPAQEPPAPASL